MMKSLLKKYYNVHKKNKAIKNNRKIFRKHIKELKKVNQFTPFPNKDLKFTIEDYGFKSQELKENFDLFYSTLRVASPDFIPIPVYLIYIEPVLNKIYYSSTIADKNYYDHYLIKVKTPKTYLRKINNHFYNSEYQNINLNNETINQTLKNVDKVILKPSVESGAGKNIKLFKKQKGIFRNKDGILNIDYLNNYNDFVLQEFVSQHPFFQQFNLDSINTIRILVYRSVISDKIHVLHKLLRIGRKGSYLDHDNEGGVTIGINVDGYLINKGKDYSGITYESFNGINFSAVEQVPFLDEIEKAAIEIAKEFYYSRLLAIDFSVNEKGEPLLIEINTKGNGIAQYQMNNGPVFKEFTKEILDYCL